MSPKEELVDQWLASAEKDLLSARRLLTVDPPLLEGACFHCQQTVEKALKAELLHNGQRPPRTHSVGDLIGLAKRWLPALDPYEPRADWITSFAVDIRYPDSRVDVSPELAQEALTMATEVLDLVRKSIHPPN